MSRWVDEIQWNSKESRERSKVHAHFAVDEHCFMADRRSIDVHITLQKMFRLGIVGAT